MSFMNFNTLFLVVQAQAEQAHLRSFHFNINSKLDEVVSKFFMYFEILSF